MLRTRHIQYSMEPRSEKRLNQLSGHLMDTIADSRKFSGETVKKFSGSVL